MKRYLECDTCQTRIYENEYVFKHKGHSPIFCSLRCAEAFYGYYNQYKVTDNLLNSICGEWRIENDTEL